MAGAMARVVFVFLDGFGLGPAHPGNPIYAHRMLEPVIGAPLAAGLSVSAPDLLAKGIDACLGVPGLPQSATGQVALFTGINAAMLLGHHLPAYPCPVLRAELGRSNLFLEALRAGKTATFANAYRPQYPEMVRAGLVQDSVTTVACRAARLPLRGLEDGAYSEAVFWDITGKSARQAGMDLEEISPEAAGAVVGTLSRRYDLVVFESFLPDLIGHARHAGRAAEFGEVATRFLAALAEDLAGEATLVLTSDHGNMEDLSTGSHTRNPVPLIARGPEARRFAAAESIADVTPAILSALAA